MSASVAHHRELQAHARERRLQVMADARQHFGALLHIAVDALAHGDEGLRRAAHFGRAVRLEIGHRAALAERFRGTNASRSIGPHLVAQEQDRHGEQQQRRNHHPQDEDRRRSRRSAACCGMTIRSTPSFTCTCRSTSVPTASA